MGLVPLTAAAQVNVEPLTEYARAPGLGVDLQGRFGLALGNVELLDLGAEAAVHYSRPFRDADEADLERAKEAGTADAWFRDRFILYGNYGLRTLGFGDDASVVLNSKLLHVRYTRMFVHRVGLEGFAQAGNDVVLQLDWRVLGGAGVRVVPLESDRIRLWAGTGAMVEFEDRAEGVEPERVTNLRWTSYASLVLALVPKKLDVLSTTYVQPSFEVFDDLQFLEEAKLRVRVTEQLALGIEGRLRLDTRPPEGTEPLDLRVTNTLEIHL